MRDKVDGDGDHEQGDELNEANAKVFDGYKRGCQCEMMEWTYGQILVSIRMELAMLCGCGGLYLLGWLYWLIDWVVVQSKTIDNSPSILWISYYS